MYSINAACVLRLACVHNRANTHKTRVRVVMHTFRMQSAGGSPHALHTHSLPSTFTARTESVARVCCNALHTLCLMPNTFWAAKMPHSLAVRRGNMSAMCRYACAPVCRRICCTKTHMLSPAHVVPNKLHAIGLFHCVNYTYNQSRVNKHTVRQCKTQTSIFAPNLSICQQASRHPAHETCVRPASWTINSAPRPCTNKFYCYGNYPPSAVARKFVAHVLCETFLRR